MQTGARCRRLGAICAAPLLLDVLLAPLVVAPAAPPAALTALEDGGPCPDSCNPSFLAAIDPGSCGPGHRCVYGDGWCRDEQWPLPFLTVKGHCTFGGAETPAPTPTPPEAPGTSENAGCPEHCNQRGLESDRGACLPGHRCVFGTNWCRDAGAPLPFMDVKGHCFFPRDSPTEAPTAEPPAAGAICAASCDQSGLEADPGACTPGRSCVYGVGWCREASHPLPLLKVTGHCFLPPKNTTTPAAAVPGAAQTSLPDDVCPCSCQQYGLFAHAGSCKPGGACVYGRGWCRDAEHPLELPVTGRCVNDNCGGPVTHAYPLTQCSNPKIPFLNVLSIIKFLLGDLTSRIKETLPSTAAINDGLDAAIATEGLQDSVQTSSGFATICNLFVDLCPAGLLPLPYCLIDTGFVPATLIAWLFAGAATWMMYLVGRSMELTGRRTFAGMWAEIVGHSTQWIPLLVLILVAFGCSLGYFCMFADLMSALVPLGAIPSWTSSRVMALLVATPVLIPLCMLKDLSALSYISAPAASATLFAVGVIVVRSVDGSYAPGGVFHHESITQPAHQDYQALFRLTPKSLQFVNVLALGFLCHYNACKYYRELIQHSPRRFASIVGTSVGATNKTFLLVMWSGYATFGSATKPVILSSYATDDMWANVARCCIGFALLGSAPLMFSGLREAVIELAKFSCDAEKRADFDTTSFQNLLTLVLLLMLIGAAIVFSNVITVLNVVGAVCGSLTIYVVPCLLYIGSLRKILGTSFYSLELVLTSVMLVSSVCT
eukprot:TRINITY_DN8486_c0_g1_i4.p1 TRINITY_DN8486_c0_g1~~TRINITY_DN8486_c0_g1_i4.p1  ORF type:complete len:773 (-),score=107.12 TRINITY_DN8486_c0_g1_i4:102-2420(-)